MYNRYIPQSDGSYRRNRIPEPPSKQPEQHPPTPPPLQESQPTPLKQKAPPCPPPPPPGAVQVRPPAHHHDSISGFLNQLLPKDFDTGDLIVVLLLLLLAGDCAEDRSTALLTLVLYLFM